MVCATMVCPSKKAKTSNMGSVFYTQYKTCFSKKSSHLIKIEGLHCRKAYILLWGAELIVLISSQYFTSL